MLVDPVFASWVRTGTPHPPGSPAGETPAERFAAYERVVMRRTNGALSGGRRPNLPWPRALGTPPWGALRELEFGASRIGTRYTLDLLRGADEYRLVERFDTLVEVVAEGEPALLYIGSALLPRHVVLVLPGDGDRMLDVYDPGTGRVGHLRRDDVVQHRVRLSGWDVPWVAVRPTGLRRVEARQAARSLGPMPA
ncbi:hypothetical protein HL663_16315 [Arthrobacter sp. NEB 688]|nr:hypothetical protein HL663_16315 [Arthrobacter sp. NEB 688]